MRGWQPIETAPRNGEVFLAYWRDMLVHVAWLEDSERPSIKMTGLWPFRKRAAVESAPAAGFHVLMIGRGGEYWAVHGNFAPFTPSHWMPLPPAPEAA